MLQYKTEIIGKKPQKLVVFLHGYNGTIEDHAYALNWCRQYLENVLFCVPLAPEICDKNPEKKQWFGMLKYDGQNRRFSADTAPEEIFEIYNQTQDEMSARAAEINDLIHELQQQYGFSAETTYIMGFSQGAMLALYVALSDENVSGGVFMLSGIIAAEKKLSQQIKAYPHVYMFHGENDGKVQFKTLAFSDKWLTNHNINHDVFTYPELAHKICEDEIIKICGIINEKTADGS